MPASLPEGEIHQFEERASFLLYDVGQLFQVVGTAQRIRRLRGPGFVRQNLLGAECQRCGPGGGKRQQPIGMR